MDAHRVSQPEGAGTEESNAMLGALSQALAALSAVSTDVNALVGSTLGNEDYLRTLDPAQLAEITNVLRDLHLTLVDAGSYSLRCRALLESESPAIRLPESASKIGNGSTSPSR